MTDAREEVRKMALVFAEGIADRAMEAGVITMACPQTFIDAAQQIESYICNGQDIAIHCVTDMTDFVRPNYND